MAIVYQSRWKSPMLVALACAAVLVVAYAAWSAWSEPTPGAAPSSLASQAWGGRDGARAEPVEESPFAGGAHGASPGSLTGIWVGAIDTGAGKRLQFSLNLREAEGELSGTARFPIGEVGIEYGKVLGTQVSFTTRHRLSATGQPLLTQFAGQLSAGMLQLSMVSEGVESRLTLKPFPG